MSRAAFDSLLSRAGVLAGIRDLVADEDGFCLVQVDGRLMLTLEYSQDADAVILGAVCGRLPEPAPASLLSEILEANYYWIGSGGGTLAINSPAGTLDLQFRESIERMEPERLKDLLGAMVINAERWQRRLDDFAAAPSAQNDMTSSAKAQLPPAGVRV
ncbi:type III secretion system chaperone [Propionivibrio soli]|uniref:type III secretion system chaperone n=1 Tax=Propionivibrio soli TaxID=2976531 RepID=UPI0021E8966D|nr:type III secretion system chaperone [Propionivibrio soli]